MPNQDYRRGGDLERAVKTELEASGYRLVIKSAGSKGRADIVALKRGETLIVQCAVSAYKSPADRRELRRLADELAVPGLTVRPLIAGWHKIGRAARTVRYLEVTDTEAPDVFPWTPPKPGGM